MAGNSRKATFNLRAVVNRTGLKPDTLRAWERRYGLPQPQRSPGGHRLYSEHDIEIMQWLMARQAAVERALEDLNAGHVETAWSDALATSQGDFSPVLLTTHEGMIIERRQRTVAASPSALYRVISGVGGDRGWPYLNWLWRLRGQMDRIIGGVGYRRGRRDPDEVRVGDAVDFWRVEAMEPGRLLRLRAEMKVPGRAWLQLEAQPLEEDTSRLVQTAFFAPKGLSGLLYWYALYPAHGLIFSGMIRAFAHLAETANVRMSDNKGVVA